MPASLPGASAAENGGNPTQGRPVMMDALSGPRGGPFDARRIASWTGGRPVYQIDNENFTTGALCTGIGFGMNYRIDGPAPASIRARGFSDDYFPGRTRPDGTNPTANVLAYIGGGRSGQNIDGVVANNPYNGTAVALCTAGNGAPRDAGGGPGYCVKMVTATTSVADGVEIEPGFTNRTGRTMTTGQSAFGDALNSNTPVT